MTTLPSLLHLPPRARKEITVAIMSDLQQDEGVVQEYLTFTLGTEEYAIDILGVQEIRSFEKPTHIANAPDFIKGVINLRGTIVPIIDMRIRFATGKVDYTPFTVVIILNIDQRMIGIIVDNVSDVTHLQSAYIRPAPAFGAAVDTSYIQGMATLDSRTLIVVDIARLLTADDMGLVEAAREHAVA